jgi:1-acyl-sn-glycerol-3-phosphate acyltransferase
MTYIRSFLFLIFIASWTLFIGLTGPFTILTRKQKIVAYVGWVWAYIVIKGLGVICGVKTKVVNAHLIPKDGCIIASKHQSAWETIFFLQYFFNPAFVLKKELQRIPIYGWYLPVLEMISIDRKGGVSIIKQMSQAAIKAFANGRNIIIFPEGTRVAFGQSIEYKSGIAALHKELPKIKILPAALNSGKVWPRKSWLIRNGTITVKFLPPITKPMPKEQLLKKLKEEIDSATNSL